MKGGKKRDCSTWKAFGPRWSSKQSEFIDARPDDAMSRGRVEKLLRLSLIIRSRSAQMFIRAR
jgi:hypothetical protein